MPDLIHGIQEPLGVRSKALSQLPNALHYIRLSALISGAPQIVNHFVHNDLHDAFVQPCMYSRQQSYDPPMPSAIIPFKESTYAELMHALHGAALLLEEQGANQ